MSELQDLVVGEEIIIDLNESISSKKHKKHRKHKKRRNNVMSVDDQEVAVDVVNDLGDIQVIIEMSAAEKLIKSQITTPKLINPNPNTVKSVPKKRRRKESGTSSEEERWLDAIESGKLEQVVDDELKKIKDPKLMTARQRAMYERGMEKEPNLRSSLLALPTYKEKVLTAEALEKAQIQSIKRKQLADERREKDKKKTMDRLLKKQESKYGKGVKNRLTKTQVPVITYRDSIVDGAMIILPPHYEFPLKAQVLREAQKPTLCIICNEIKKYNCSKTKVPLCSFKCYKKNVDSVKAIIC